MSSGSRLEPPSSTSVLGIGTDIIQCLRITRMIEKHGDVGAKLLGLAADSLDHFRRPFVLGVAHVEAEHIGSGIDELADQFL